MNRTAVKRDGAPAPSDGAQVGDLGERLRDFRRQRSLTLSDVSQQTGVSISTLSKIENMQVSPSFDVIMRISEGLGVSIEDLVRRSAKSHISGRRAVTRTGEGVHISTDAYDYKVHATDLVQKHMVPLEMRVRARSPADFDHWSRHPGEEYVYVLAGEIEIHTEHYAPFRLKAGESAYFDSSMAHVYVSTSRIDARVLSVSYDPNLGTSPIGGR